MSIRITPSLIVLSSSAALLTANVALAQDEATGSGAPGADAAGADGTAGDAPLTNDGDGDTASGEEDTAPTKILLTPQSDPITGPRTFHMHDGFYVRGNFGYGFLWGSYDRDGEEPISADGSGIAIDLLIGGAPSPGFIVGGGLVGAWLFAADFEQDGQRTSSHDVGAGLLGVFVDGYFNPSDGWHLGGLLGLGGQTLSSDAVTDSTAGFGGAIWAGYDQWVGDDFSVGGLLRFTLMRSTGNDDDNEDVTANTGSLSLMFTAVYQ